MVIPLMGAVTDQKMHQCNFSILLFIWGDMFNIFVY